MVEKSLKGKEIDDITESERIVKTAAKLIKPELKSDKNFINEYPSKEDIKDHSNSLALPLRLFMKELVVGEVKQSSSLGQAIKKAIKTRSYVPSLFFRLGVELVHMFGSKWLLNELFRLGFSISYLEVTRLKYSVLATKDTGAEGALNGVFTQWVADNIDHNICAVDGKSTLHGMWVISVGTRERQQTRSAKTAKTQSGKKTSHVVKIRGDYIHVAGLCKIVFRPLIELQNPTLFSPSLGIDLWWHSSMIHLWHSSKIVHDLNFVGGSYPTKSDIFMLPIININPSEDTCV